MGGVHKPRGTVDHFDAIARKLGLGDVGFSLDDVLDAEAQVPHGDLFLHAVADAIDALILEPGEVQHGLAHGLAGDGAGIDAGTADHFTPFD